MLGIPLLILGIAFIVRSILTISESTDLPTVFLCILSLTAGCLISFGAGGMLYVYWCDRKKSNNGVVGK